MAINDWPASERPREKLLRIRDRFLNNDEAATVGADLDLLCRYWAGKEVLYKIYGRKNVTFMRIPAGFRRLFDTEF